MLDAGGGGGYGGTNWNAVSVIDMWLAVGNQETTAHWELLVGWRKSYELTLQHMTAVRNYRENLASAWPPESSPASAAYIGRLDELIAHLQQTYDAAVANYGAFSGATLALSSARPDLEKVVNEYLANENKLATFEREQAEKPTNAGLMQRQPVKPPVPDGRQAQLEAQARSIMFGLSSELMQARTQVTKPAPYEKMGRVNDNKGTDSGADYSAPPIPPIVAFDPGAGSSPTAHAAAPSQNGSSSGTSPHPRQPGLVLGGIDPPIAQPPTQLPPPPPPGPGPGPTPPVISPGPVAPSSMRVPTAPTRFPTGTPATNQLGIPPGAMRAMPPGGVIGGVPGMGLNQPSGARGVQAVSPVGGVIGPNTGSNSGASRGGAMVGQPIGAPGRNSDRPGEHDGSGRWDPDNPWATAEGVAPVVLPAAEQRIDPGPAIGLS